MNPAILAVLDIPNHPAISRILPLVLEKYGRLRRRILRLWSFWFVSVAVLFMYFGYQQRYVELVFGIIVAFVSRYLLRRYSLRIWEESQENDVLTVEPKTAEEYCNRGDVFLEWDETEAAIQDYETAVRTDTDIIWAATVAELLMELKEYHRAEPYIEQILKTTPRDWTHHDDDQYTAWRAEALYYKGIIAAAKNDVRAAEKYFRKSIDTVPDLEEYHLEMVKLLLDQNRFEDAAEFLAAAAKISKDDRKQGYPESPLLSELFGRFATHRKDFPTAVAAFRRAVRLESTPQRVQLLQSAIANLGQKTSKISTPPALP